MEFLLRRNVKVVNENKYIEYKITYHLSNFGHIKDKKRKEKTKNF